MDDHFTFARFWRCALQVNPFSYQGAYRGSDHGFDEDQYNHALLEKCLAHDIKVVGIADHGSVVSVHSLRKVLEPNGIVVFPGFEIAANDKTHYVCLFPEDTGTQQLERYLGNLDLLDPADGVRPSGLSSEQLIDKVDQLGGFIYAAHCTQDSGLLKNRLNHVWKLPKLRAAQIPGALEDLAGVESDFYSRVLKNKDDAYKRKRLVALINAKDISKPSDLEHAGATCLIKMTRPTFAAFKVAFLDPASRIRLNSKLAKSPVGRVLSMAVAGGYLDGLKVNFSDHLNTVIGGRGTGKSTLLECLRFALDLAPKGKQAQKLHQEIIKENLGRAAGRVELVVVSSAQNGKQYTVSRRYGELPVVRDVNGDVSTMLPRELLPGLDIYGQNEIYELAQDEASRLQLLDRFLPQDDDYEKKRFDAQKRLKENHLKFVDSLSGLDDIEFELNRLPNLEEQLRDYETLGVAEKLATTSLLARERVLVGTAKESLKSYENALVCLRQAFPDLSFMNDEAINGVPDRDVLVAMRRVLESLKMDFETHLTVMEGLVSNGQTQFSTEHDAWLLAVQEHDKDLEKELRKLPETAGKSGQEIGVAYQKLQGDIEHIRPLGAKLPLYQKQCETQDLERRSILAELSGLRSLRLDALQKGAKKLTRKLDGKLRIEVVPEADRSPLMAYLLGCKLEGIGEKRLAWIEEVETISPSLLVASIRQGSMMLQLEWGLTPLVADALAKLQPSQIMELEALELEHRVDISLNVAHGDAEPLFRPLNKLSTGQQCTAILHMLLLDNIDPLFMDQPEDNLDNAFIAERIVTELRDAKTNRQFLFATHNANIPVFGDAEWIGVFTTEENRGCLPPDAQGSIDVTLIRDQVARILEGGRDAFIQRMEKYEF
ncbi:AAA domain-containing protein [Pseudomonas helmanticensis]|uniref:AAA domain-containing protein n=1 Tax=Pseudomonas helmanticensis TaxID=1471381 RepID=A0A4R7UR37_9PSED|nr:AAA family ATPase [Pseudomonas helmanticensis]TDV37517.1 AAA domain-containing protein [Pseudomonas helmanticensis]